MKTIITRQLLKVKVILTVSIILTFTSCTKEKEAQCEEWEVEYEKFNIGGCNDFSCSGSRTVQLIFCGSSLKDAKAGNIITTSEDQCCKKTMTFKRFIKKV